MIEKEVLTIIFSTAAIIISLISLVLTILHRNKESKINVRKTLSDGLEQIAKINIELSKLRKESIDYNDENIINIRRNYNSQKRILIANADYLITKYDDLITEIDCNLIAGAYSSIGDFPKAEKYWVKTIEKSDSNSVKHMNLRGFASFLFHQGKFQLGRTK